LIIDMGRRQHLIVIIGALAAALVMIAGCGGGSSSSDTTSSPGASSSEPHSAPVGSAAPSREFMKKGSNTKWATFGAVASEEEREAASKVLAANLRARQAGEWEAQCSSLTKKAMKELTRKAGSGPLLEACVKELENIAKPLKASAGARRDNLHGEIDVLRVEGERAVALFHGQGDTDYGMSMEKEDGEWKVAAVLTAEIN
jgi:hypothetical protein